MLIVNWLKMNPSFGMEALKFVFPGEPDGMFNGEMEVVDDGITNDMCKREFGESRVGTPDVAHSVLKINKSESELDGIPAPIL
jgi:hypothetical protein